MIQLLDGIVTSGYDVIRRWQNSDSLAKGMLMVTPLLREDVPLGSLDMREGIRSAFRTSEDRLKLYD